MQLPTVRQDGNLEEIFKTKTTKSSIPSEDKMKHPVSSIYEKTTLNRNHTCNCNRHHASRYQLEHSNRVRTATPPATSGSQGNCAATGTRRSLPSDRFSNLSAAYQFTLCAKA